MEGFAIVSMMFVFFIHTGVAADIGEGEDMLQCRQGGNGALIQKGRAKQAQDASQASLAFVLAGRESSAKEHRLSFKLVDTLNVSSDSLQFSSPIMTNSTVLSTKNSATEGKQSVSLLNTSLGKLNGSFDSLQFSSPTMTNSSVMSTNNSATEGMQSVSLLNTSVGKLNGSSDSTQLHSLPILPSVSSANNSATGGASKVSLIVIFLPLTLCVACVFCIASVRCCNLRSGQYGPQSGSRANMPPYRLDPRSVRNDTESFPPPTLRESYGDHAITSKGVHHSNAAMDGAIGGSSTVFSARDRLKSSPAAISTIKLASFGPLCAELVGPSRNESIIALPSLGDVASEVSVIDRAQTSRSVLDRTQACRTGETSVCERMIKSKTGLDIVKVIVTHLADSQRISLVAAKTQKLLGFCEFKSVVIGDPFRCWIYRSTGEFLAVLEQKLPALGQEALIQPSLPSPALGQEAAIDPSLYFLTTMTAASTTYQIEGDVERRRLRVMDCIRKEEVMSVDGEGKFEFQQGANEYYRLRVRPKADAGVVILALFAIDRSLLPNSCLSDA